MLGAARVAPTIPVMDMERAKAFYRDTLGLKVVEEFRFGVRLDAGEGSVVILYPRGETMRDHTFAVFEVDDLEAAMRALTKRGVEFDDVDIPGFEGASKVADLEGVRSAWFKDSEGNILSIGQRAA